MSEILATSPGLPGEALTVEGRLADIIERDGEVWIGPGKDGYRLSDEDRGKVIAALRALSPPEPTEQQIEAGALALLQQRTHPPVKALSRDLASDHARSEATTVLLAARSIPLQDCGWRPMETAPKDGAPFIYQNSDEAVSTCSWQADDCGHSWWDIAGDQIAYPVRWMPLPPVRSMVAEQGTEAKK